MNKIRIMDPQLANMIAAGEVVERPSGIVKELVENSLDAHATDIQVEIIEGGMQEIRVIDNGIGMNKEDLQNAFQRHSTSKIHNVMDLNQIQTFGFRGEALPSIASVSEILMQSNNGQESHQIMIDNGKVLSMDVFARNKGTTISVSHLFSKVPARLKYIKNPKYETSIIVDVIQKFAMAHPSISFSLKDENKVLFKSFGNDQLHDVFYRIFGREVAQEPLSLEFENYDFKVNALIAQPQHTRSNRHSLWIYINDRMVRHARIQNAVVEGYRRHIPSDRYPIGVIKIQVDPQLVDVNVHPSKWEIRLSKESDLIAMIINQVESSLTQKTKVKRIKVESEQTSILNELLNQPKLSEPENKETRTPIYEVPIQEEHDLSVQVEEETSEVKSTEDEKIEEKAIIEPLTILSQFSGKYILAQGEKGLYIIDQHAAMERVRYEYFQSKLLNKHTGTQPLLIPVVLEGRSSLIHREKDVKEAFETLHMNIEILDDDAFVIRERPLWMKEAELIEFSNRTLDYLEDHKTIREADFRNHSLATLACHSSVRFNEYMSQIEMETLVEQLRTADQPFHCPHGRPTFMIVEHSDLIKGFLR